MAMNKTILEIVPNPQFKEHTMFTEQRDFVSTMREQKCVFVDVHPHTKTSVSIALHLDKFRYGANSVATAGFKYLEKRETNYFAGVTYTAYYLKAKALADVQKHVETLMEHFFPSLDLNGFTLKFYNTPKVEELARWKYPV
jgi:hypothetical protein